MNDSFSRRGTLTPQPQVCRIVRLRIGLSMRHPSAPADLDRRLTALLRDANVSVTDRHVTLIRPRRAITPADWSAVIGWLMRQPEVVFVAREYPITGRSNAAR